MSRPARRPRVEELEPRSLPSTSAVWTVVGDRQPGQPDDTIVVRRDPLHADLLQAVVNGEVVSTHAAAGLERIRVFAGAGNDTVSIDLGNRASRLLVVVRGGSGDDIITGTNGRDDLRGGLGDDTIDGAGGDDRLFGGRGDDRLHGGRGGDRLDAGVGTDTFYGNNSEDRVVRAGDSPRYLADNANPLHPVSSVAELRDWIAKHSATDWSGWFGQPGMVFAGGDPPPTPPGGDPGAPGTAGGSTDPNGGTNTQEQGVDEADILKTDGRYLYTVVGNELLVIDARAPESLAVVGRVAIDGVNSWSGAFYLMGDRVVVVSQVYEYHAPDSWPADPVDLPAGGGAPLWWGAFYRPKTIVTTIDLTDRTAPAVVCATTLDGSLLDSRAVGDRVYVVVANTLFFPQPVLLATAGGPVYESEADYSARVEAGLDDSLPEYTTTDYEGGAAAEGTGSLVEGAELYLPDVAGGSQLVSVAAFDPAADAPGPVAVTTVAGASGTVYASQQSLYIAATDYSSPWRDGGETTQLYKFALGADAVPLAAVGAVDGTVLNQFSMDEEGGSFRIATTSGWGADAGSAVYVMADAGGGLQVVGSVEDLGLGERVYSVRFEGDTGYVTTFQHVDPLFVLDLRDPTAPAVVGELDIPGYSSYLQVLGGGRVIGLGRDADPDTGAVLGLQLSLFDVSDPTHPSRVDTYTFGRDSWGGWSEAEWDHHAISWFADAGVLALPVTIDLEQSATLEVLGVGTGGIDLLGEVAHDSPVLRSLRIGDVLFSMSADEIQAHVLTDPSVAIGSVALS